MVGTLAETHFDYPVGPLSQFGVHLVLFERLLISQLDVDVQKLPHGFFFTDFPFPLLHSLDLELVHIVGRILLLHQTVDELFVLQFCTLLLLLQ